PRSAEHPSRARSSGPPRVRVSPRPRPPLLPLALRQRTSARRRAGLRRPRGRRHRRCPARRQGPRGDHQRLRGRPHQPPPPPPPPPPLPFRSISTQRGVTVMTLSPTAPPQHDVSAGARRRQTRKVALASLIGTTV